MRALLLTGLLLAAGFLPACAVVTVTGAVVGAAVSVTGAVVSTGVKVTGKAVGAAIDAVSPAGEVPAPPRD